MKRDKGEAKLVFNIWPKYKKFCAVFFGIYCGIGFIVMVAALCAAEWATAAVCGGCGVFFALIWFMIRMAYSARRIEFYSDRVVFWHEQAWAWPSMEARYEDICGACISKADEYGDHVQARGKYIDYDVDTLCVYCKNGEYILFGLYRWGQEYSRRVLDEILRRADVQESEPEEGEYGGGSEAAKAGFAELGVEEEEQPADDPEENRFDIEAIVGCELYTENGVRVGKIVQVLPAETDIYIVERNGKEMQLPAEEGVFLDMDAERKRMTVDADQFFASIKEQE